MASGGGTYLSVDWRYPPGIAPSYFPLLFQLRYREVGSSVWVVSPLSFPARTPLGATPTDPSVPRSWGAATGSVAKAAGGLPALNIEPLRKLL